VDISKALGALNVAAAAAENRLPEVIDPVIQDFVSTIPSIYNLVDHQPWASNTYFVRRRTALPTASWRADGGTLPSADRAEYDRVQKSVKYLYARGEVTGPMQEAAGGLYNALGNEVEEHTQGMIEKLSSDIVTATGAADSIEGILYQIDTDVDLNAGGGTLDVSGRPAAEKHLSLELLDEAIDLTKNTGDIIIASGTIRRRIARLLQGQQMFQGSVEVMAGFRVREYDGLPLISAPEWESNTDILIFRRADAQLLVHKDITYEELAKTKDSTDFMLKGYFGFRLRGRPVHLTGFDLL
jgi:hypothetical protein